MFTNNFKLDGIENILDDIGYLSEEAKDENDAGEKAGEKYEGKYKKTGKKSRDYDDDGTVEDEADEYAGVKDKAIKDAQGEDEDKKEKKKKSEKEVNEKIDVGADAGKTISDFVHSSAKTFSGDSKKQRIKRALGAYYGAQKEEVEHIEEAGTMQGGGKDPCWKGYEMVGMKKKGGREVPNCVPKEEYEELVMDMIEEGYDMDQVREVIAAFEDGFEVIFEEDGVTINDTQEVLDEEAQFLSDVEMVADWLYTEGVIENEDQFFELMEDLSEEEIQDIYDLVLAEAEGSYGQTPKAREAMGKLTVSRMRKPASEYSQRGEKTKKVKAAEKHASRQNRLASGNNRHGSRGPMDQARRNWSRGADEYGHTGYDGEGHGGSVTKNPKKLRKQKAMGEISKEEFEIDEATAMAKRGYDETKLRSRAGGGEAADRASALEKKPTYGDANKEKQRQNYARAQRGDFRKTASSNPGLHGYAHKSNDPKVKAKQAARGAQRGALTPKERKDLNMGYEMIGNSLEEGGLEVRNYSWKEVMEAQVARNNPEKYEREQAKKTSKSAMPPRGDKRREDFEKWYAANVR
jgi:hypothetical protein